jgi:hypothetical protein
MSLCLIFFHFFQNVFVNFALCLCMLVLPCTHIRQLGKGGDQLLQELVLEVVELIEGA